jgi:hypothetical protein
MGMQIISEYPLKITVFWDTRPCSLVGRWVGTYASEEPVAFIIRIPYDGSCTSSQISTNIYQTA